MRLRQPTLLVFTRGPEAEARRKRLLPSCWSGVETRLYAECLSAAIAAGRESGCRVVVSSPSPLPLEPGIGFLEQRGETFGRRLEHSLERMSHESPWVLVGADNPDLSAAVIRQGLDALGRDPRRVVIGPSPDGGFYLLAAQAPLAALLAGTRWRSRFTREDLRRRLESAGFEIHWLAPLADLDAREDLERWLSSARDEAWRGVTRVLHALLAELKLAFLPPHLGHFRPAVVTVRRGRAPPNPT